MKIGIKVGPQSNSIPDLEATGAHFCEVWFDVNRYTEYAGLFDHIRKNRIETGLHFWGVLEDNIWTNLAHPDLADQTAVLIRRTIDIAAENGYAYVNFHPGSRAKIRLELPDFRFSILSEPIDTHIAETCLLEHAIILHNHAAAKGVILTIESVPSRVNDPKNRLSAINVFELTGDIMEKIAGAGMAVANDFGHTASHIISTDRNSVWEYLYDFTAKLAPQTRLLHVGFIRDPYNGTDFHDTFENELFYTDRAVPNHDEMLKLLGLFKNRGDVWALIEPEKNHVGNFKLLQNLVLEAGI